ncbi:unknown [Bacillus sp. CAG:988]|nr:unknown [Bacillus sp. CAG:988]
MKKKFRILLRLLIFILMIAVDAFYLFYIYHSKGDLSLQIVINFDPLLFRVMIVFNVLILAYFISKIMNYGTKIVSIRPFQASINKETGEITILFTSQTKDNVRMYTDLKKYFVYVTKNKRKFVKDKFYFIDLNQYGGNLTKVSLGGLPEAYDLREFREKDFK